MTDFVLHVVRSALCRSVHVDGIATQKQNGIDQFRPRCGRFGYSLPAVVAYTMKVTFCIRRSAVGNCSRNGLAFY